MTQPKSFLKVFPAIGSLHNLTNLSSKNRGFAGTSPLHGIIRFKSNFRMFSPLQVFIGDLAPASSANWQLPILVVDVELNVAACAFSVPRVLTVFS